MIKQCDEVALFQKMKKMKSDIENLKSVDVTSLPSATYNRTNANFPDVEILFGTSVVYVFVVPSITFALERTLSTFESKYLDISVCTSLLESFISLTFLM
jgi:hypothetical protein